VPAFSFQQMLLIALIVMAGGRSAQHEHAALAETALTGTITGEVALKRAPARRVAERYVGAAPAAERPMQEIPAVVYLKGSFETGGTPRPRPRLVQQDTTFVPGALTVQVGTTVEFPNGDPIFHNVFSYSKPKRFDLGRYPRGESKSVRFDEPGIVRIYCEVHKSMRALVVVVPGPHHAVVDETGRFTLADVPPGSYELVAVDADRGTRTVRVTVSAGQTSRVMVSLP
jgi:hypothetical protein